MSLLEDVFLEDEAGEAQDLERIIEGDEYDERPRDRSDSDENSAKEDEAEEDKRRVDPASTKTKRVIKNPRFILNPARLTGPRGIQVIPEHFKYFKFKGKGHEKEDLDLVLKKLEHWAYRLYPKFEFEDCLKKIETLGKKRPVMVHLTKIRSDQLVSEETVVQQDSSDDEPPPAEEDEFDKLLAQQIELARNTPGPGSVKKPGFATPVNPIGDKISPITIPKATSSPSISDEQRERMIRNRKLAEERRLARLKAQTQNDGNTIDLTNIIQNGPNNESGSINKIGNNNEGGYSNNVGNSNESGNKNNDVATISEDENEEMNEIKARKNRSNIIESSDSENDMIIDETINANDKNDFKNKTAKNTDMPSEEDSNSCNDIIDITKGYQRIQVNNENTRFDQLMTIDSETIDITNEIVKSKEVVAIDSDIIDMTTKDTRFDQFLTVDSETNDKTNETVKSKLVALDSDIIDMTRTKDTRFDQVLTVDSEINDKTNETEKSKEISALNSEIVDLRERENISITIDKITEINEVQSEKTRENISFQSNIMYSSDSDDDVGVMAVNETITVDVHKYSSQGKKYNTNDSKEISENINETENLQNNDVIVKNGNEKSNDKTKNQTSVVLDNDFEVKSNDDNKNNNKKSSDGLSKDLDLITNYENLNKKDDSQTRISHKPDLEIVCEKYTFLVHGENQEKLNQTNEADHRNVIKEIIDSNETELEDLMDVYFSDDF